MFSRAAIETPCISICRLSDGVCVGCRRTRDEIGRWRSMDDAERSRIMRELDDRPAPSELPDVNAFAR